MARTPRVLRPLRERDFALLFTGIAVSMLGDGITMVALAWQVYEISNVPTALSVVGLAWTLPLVGFLLFGGVLADRVPRRRVLIAADLLRTLALAAIGVLSIIGSLELWHVVVLVIPFGIGEALFAPAWDATIPEIVPRHLLVQANSLNSLTEPVSFRAAGPAIGGLLVAGVGPGVAFLIDAATFLFSAACIALMRARPAANPEPEDSVRSEIAAGLRFVRGQPWLWAGLLGAAIGLLLYYGPLEVLLPYLVRNELDAGAGGFGLILGATGVGAVLVAILLGQRGLARNHVVVMYVSFAAGFACLALYPLAGSVAAAMAVGAVEGLLFAVGEITWMTMMQSYVPREILGRVSALDYLVSFGLVPVSFALAGPAAALFGVEETMIGAGVLAALVFVGFLFIPGVRAPERWAAEERALAGGA